MILVWEALKKTCEQNTQLMDSTNAMADSSCASSPKVANMPNSRLIYIFPCVLAATFAILSLLGISGTSIGVLNSDPPSQSSRSHVIAGTPQTIRSDEWDVQTPLIVAQSHSGFSQTMGVGLGVHDLSVIYDIPTRSWSTIFKPWDVFPLFLSLDQGFAARWWAMSFILIIGIYALLLELTGRLDLAVFLSLGFWLSPFFQWWYLDISICTVGLGAFALLFLLRAIRSEGYLKFVRNLVGAIYFAVAFSLIIYPPFQIPVIIVLAFVGIADVGLNISSKSIRWKRVVITLGVTGVASVSILALFYLENRNAIRAINNSVYPGQRRSLGGQASLLQLLSAPFGLTLSRFGNGLSETNQSEISSFLLFGPFVLLQLFRTGLKSLDRRSRWLLTGASVSFGLIFTWYLIGLPNIIAGLFLLNRVPVGRSIIGIGIAGLLMIAIFSSADISSNHQSEVESSSSGRLKLWKVRSLSLGAVLCGLVVFVTYVWGGEILKVTSPDIHLNSHTIILFSLMAAIVIGLFAAQSIRLGGISFLIFGIITAAVVNPLYIGLRPLTESSLATDLEAISKHYALSSERVWLSYAGANVSDPLEASGLPTVNAVQLYPDSSFWVSVLGGTSSSSIWNRYAHVSFVSGTEGSKPKVNLISADSFSFTFDPCGPTATKLHLGFFISQEIMNNSCFVKVSSISYQGATYQVYRRQ